MKARSSHSRRPSHNPTPVPILLLAPAFMVIDKPAGLAVHPGPKTPQSLEQMLDLLRSGYSHAPVPVHRLDRDTSGCLLLARRPSAHKRLSAMFEAHQIGKSYWAIANHAPSQTSGVIDRPLKKISSEKLGWRVVADPAGKPAQTHYQVLAHDGTQAWLELTPMTGRTHQLRVHCAEIGCSIVGDPIYGEGDGPMLLHARSLTIPWDDDKPAIHVVCDPPAAFEAPRLRISQGAIAAT